MNDLKDLALIEGVIQKALVCRLALAVEGEPYLAPVCFGYAGGQLFIHSGRGGKKLEMLAANPRVCFELETDVAVLPNSSPCRFSMRYRSVIGYGRAFRLHEEAEQRAGLDAIIRQYGATPGEYGREALHGVEVYAIVIDAMTYKQHHIIDDV
ncbi:MAG TPA: pyridoxamine 5'-phosphate oxidase family protein [Levilinea sp.]|nr:pyridoxamine 5'-phosphate oxidase family protein [Levilinea sp.]